MLALLIVVSAAPAAAGPGAPPLAVPAPEIAAGPADTGPRLLRVGAGGTAAAAAAVEAGGGQVLAVVGDDAVLVLGPVTAEAAGVLDARRWTGRQAVLPTLAELDARSAERFAGGVPVVAALASAADLDALVSALPGPVRVAWTGPGPALGEVGLRVPTEALDELRAVLGAAQGLVWADVVPGARLRNDASAWRCQSGQSGSTPLFDAGLRGEGEVIAVIDTGIDPDSCYFADAGFGMPAVNGPDGVATSPGHRKLLAVDFLWDADWPEPGSVRWDDHGHGTHVAGSAAGDGGAPGAHDGYDGMAPASLLVIQDGGFGVDDCADLPALGCPLAPLTPVLAQARSQGARIHTNSWGDAENFRPSNRYTERTAEIDRFVWQHPDAVVLVAAGNSGGEGDGTVGSPATGKNLLGVGAAFHGSASAPCVAGFSSRGWTADGRIKPDLLAPGASVRSARSDGATTTGNCDIRLASGTSMAAPTAAGLAALVRQFFREGRVPDGLPDPGRSHRPSAALVRATLVASAVDVTSLGCTSARPVPSPDQGWGLIQLDTALPLPGSARRLLVRDDLPGFSDAASEPGSTAVALTSPGPLKVVLAWTDPPSFAAAAAHLVNDLDLEVEGPDGRFRGNAFAGGRSTGGGEPDRLNNLEVVWLPQASAGTWVVRVSPHAIRRGTQPYALVVAGELAAPGPRRPSRRVGGEE